MEIKDFSCVDCAVRNCKKRKEDYPGYCPTGNLSDEMKNEVMDLYMEKENNAAAKASAEISFEHYHQTRIQDTIDFANKIGAKKLGIATCMGLLDESVILAKILRAKGFEVYSINCKAGSVSKEDIGIPSEQTGSGSPMCNPILQAKILNEEKTDLNIVVGLCVGHDSLFYKYSEALTTTLITKDRALGHNPAAAIYTANSFYKDILF